MALDVEIPDPPTLREPQDPGNYDAVEEPDEWTGEESPRQALADFLRDGAWEDAFEEWREHTYLSETEFALVRDLGLIDRFDFYWNPSAEDVGYRAPSLPADVPDRHREALADADRQDIEEGLDDLGRTVSEVLENGYVDREDDEFGFFDDR